MVCHGGTEKSIILFLCVSVPPWRKNLRNGMSDAGGEGYGAHYKGSDTGTFGSGKLDIVFVAIGCQVISICWCDNNYRLSTGNDLSFLQNCFAVRLHSVELQGEN